jgi:hypothetical protein
LFAADLYVVRALIATCNASDASVADMVVHSFQARLQREKSSSTVDR